MLTKTSQNAARKEESKLEEKGEGKKPAMNKSEGEFGRRGGKKGVENREKKQRANQVAAEEESTEGSEMGEDNSEIKKERRPPAIVVREAGKLKMIREEA